MLCKTTFLSFSPQPPYSYRINECAELICFNGELLLHNSSLHCRYNTTPPRCSLLGLPILINTDPCCPQWQCPCMFACLCNKSDAPLIMGRPRAFNPSSVAMICVWSYWNNFPLPGRCTMMSDLRVITFDGNNVALYDNGSYILVNLPRETIIGTVEKCPTSQVTDREWKNEIWTVS